MEKSYYNRQTEAAPRQSNFELLRIIAMVMIVAHHFSVHGGFTFASNTITLNKLWIQFIQMGGKIGVNLFVMASGYFLVKSSTIKTNKVARLWLQIFFYSILIFIVFIGTGLESFHITKFIKIIFPITYSEWWYASAYFILYLTSPFLNILLTNLDKKTYQKMLLLLIVCWCLVPTVLVSRNQSNNLLWFIFLYAAAGYIRLWGQQIKINKQSCLVLSAVLIALTFLSVVVFDLIGLKIASFSNHATFFYDMQRLPIILISLFMFLGFEKMNLGCIKSINIISSAAFGVYLIHDNNFMRSFLWKSVFKNATYSNSAYLIPYSILVIIFVFAVCTAVELVRIYVLEKHYMRFVDTISYIIDVNIKRFFELKIFDKI